MSARIGSMIVHAAVAGGADPARLQELTGFDPALAADPDARISLELEARLWDEGARLTGDDALGLHAARLLQPGAFDVLDYACRTAPTLRAAYERLIRYNRLEHDAAVFRMVDGVTTTRMEHRFRIAGSEQSRHSAEFTLAALAVISAQIAGIELRPSGVEFRHAAPASMAAHLELFGVEPRFDCDANVLELDRGVLDRPCPRPDPALWRIIERQAEALLAARPEGIETAADRVRRLLVATLGEGAASLGAIAKRLRMSERTLQRRLGDEGVTFDGPVDDLRKQLAIRYLADRSLAIGEVAYLLGYSEPSAFYRAFRRWTGTTPAEIRTQMS
jgi:AraC-like DNA-binding protein